MTDEAPAVDGRRTPESYRQQIAHALDHADDLIAAAERVLAGDNGYPNIAYHLGILAMEEIGRAGILAQAMVAGRIGARRNEQRLDDHVFKLMHAVWTPAFNGGKIDPKDWEDARAFAQSTHARRMAGLYADHEPDDGASAPPRDSVQLGHAISIVGLAKARLALQRAEGVPSGETNEELEWYLDTVSDDLGRKRLFSKPFIAKYEEFEGDTRAWVTWAQAEFERISAEEHALLQREFAREITDADKGVPKWKIKIRLHSTSHSMRPAALNYWNQRIDGVKFIPISSDKQQLRMEMTLPGAVTLDSVFDAGLSVSKLYIAAISVGSGGVFWYELTTQGVKYFESLREVQAPDAEVEIETKRRGLALEWAEGKRKYLALEESHMENAIRFLAVFAPLSNEEARPILGPYLRGMTMLVKSDIHLSLERQAQQDFLKTIRAAMRQFKDWDGEEDTFISSLHRVLSDVMPEQHREQLFGHLMRPDATEEELQTDAVNTKRVADVYLSVVAWRLWPAFTKRAGDKKSVSLR
jgi:AbiV family abortive infection protein